MSSRNVATCGGPKCNNIVCCGTQNALSNVFFHRAKRSKGTFKNELEDIPGIGETTANTLLQTFRSVKKVREASLKDLAKVVGQAKAVAIMDYFEGKG